jgi:ubiquinone/menaquinone biosynthesis C-methylase UbiE
MSENVLRQEIIEYYTSSEKHYRYMWGLDRDMALHYGFWGSGALNHSQALMAMNEEMAIRGRVRKGDRVLDAGCGVGGSSIFLARQHGCMVTGITIVDRQLELARDNAKRHQVDGRAQFENRDFCKTGFADGSFDVVWFLESACHAQEKADLLREAHRVLRPGGRIICGDFFRIDAKLADKDEALMAGWEDAWAVPRFETIESFTAKMQGVGFADIDARDETDNIAQSARRLNTQYYFGITLKTIRRLWRKSSPRKFKNVWSARAQEKARRRGLWRYQIVSGKKSL